MGAANTRFCEDRCAVFIARFVRQQHLGQDQASERDEMDLRSNACHAPKSAGILQEKSDRISEFSAAWVCVGKPSYV